MSAGREERRADGHAPSSATGSGTIATPSPAATKRAGRWPHLWRIVGEYANVSVFDVESNDALHELLSGLPLFPYMDVTVTALARHPSDIHA